MSIQSMLTEAREWRRLRNLAFAMVGALLSGLVFQAVAG